MMRPISRAAGIARITLFPLVLAWGPGFAEDGEAGAAIPLDTVEVVGIRDSLATSQSIRRDSSRIVDAVVAPDITKLPDANVAEALQRVTGVQITRDRGEGSAVAIRGLSQVETLLNGREVFTAGSGRALNYADMPALLISGIDVYKTTSADQIEGGVGGTVDLRTPRPFDFADRRVVASGRVVHGNLVDDERPQFASLMSDRWTVDGMGEIGALLGFTWQQRGFREDQKTAGNPIARDDLIPGRTIFAPGSTSETASAGVRERTAANAVLQWRPTDSLELYAEYTFVEFLTEQDSHQINVSAPGPAAFVPGSAQLFDGTDDLRRITWTNAPLSILSFARDTEDRTRQAAIGGSWTGERLTLQTDISHTSSYNNLFFSGPIFRGTAGTFTQDLSGDLPATAVGGIDLLDPGALSYTGLAYRTVPFDGDLTAVRLDAIYDVPGGFIDSIAVGWRRADRGATNAPGLSFADVALAGLTMADTPGRVQRNPYGRVFEDADEASIGPYLVGSLDGARDALTYRDSFGVTNAIPDGSGPLGVWEINERTQSLYLHGDFSLEAASLDGFAGLRVVETREQLIGARSLPDSGGVAALDIDNRYLDYLPSIGLRYRWRDRLQLRGAASETLTRPDFLQLSPSLLLLRNSVNPELNIGTAGNPDLQPVRSSNLDAAIELYFNDTAFAYVSGFLKHVEGFVTTVSAPETYDGVTYQVSRPRNTDKGRIRGVEIGYQQFYDFLPGLWRGLGLQANYTFVDSETPSALLGFDVPLQNLSRHSYNLIGMYERDRLSVRVAYNWRDRFLSGISSFVGVGATPVYTKAYGWLDASVGFRVNDYLSLGLEGANLLNTVRESYYGVETRPQNDFLNDRQIIGTVTITF